MSAEQTRDRCRQVMYWQAGARRSDSRHECELPDGHDGFHRAASGYTWGARPAERNGEHREVAEPAPKPAADETRVVLVKPSDVLLIAGAPLLDDRVREAVAEFFRAAGIQVMVFGDDISMGVARSEILDPEGRCPVYPDGQHRNTRSLIPASYSRCECGATSEYNPDRFA